MAGVYIHIGLHKTGTTSLQRYFLHHGDAGTLGDIDYPMIPATRNSRAHHILAGFGGPRSGEAIARLVDVIANSKADHVVLSSELLSLADPARVRETLGCDAAIVVYLRRQDEYLESFYREVVKMSHYHGSPDEFVHSALDQESVTLVTRGKTKVNEAVPVYFSQLVDRWSAVFTDVRVRVYGNPAEGFDIVEDFADVTGLDLPGGSPPSVNESFPVKLLQFRQAIDRQLSAEQRRELSPFLWRVSQTLGDPTPNGFISPGLRAEIVRRCADDNVRLAEVLGTEGVFDEFDPLDQPAEIDPLSETEFAAFAGLLVGQLLKRN